MTPMPIPASDRALRRTAIATWWAFVAATAAATTVAVVARREDANLPPLLPELGFDIVVVAFAFTGLLILRQQPRNVVGWVLMGVGASWGLADAAGAYATYGLVVAPGSVPAPVVVAALWQGMWAPGITLMTTFSILLFPDGRLPSRRWRPVAWVAALAIVAMYAGVTVGPGDMDEGVATGRPNPLGVLHLEGLALPAVQVGVGLLAGCILASACALVLRFRRSRGVQREQLKWLAAAGAVAATLFVANMTSPPGPPDQPGWIALQTASRVSFLLIPGAIGVAILRHRLWDIDVVVNRALVYLALSVTLVGTYLASVLLLRGALAPLTGDSDLAVAGSTLAVAALFRPARSRIQALVDRRFYRSRYDAALTLATFSSSLRAELDLDSLGTDLRGVVRDTMQPEHVSLWLRPGVPR